MAPTDIVELGNTTRIFLLYFVVVLYKQLQKCQNDNIKLIAVTCHLPPSYVGVSALS